MPLNFSLRIKILGILALLLITAISFYTLLASTIFSQEKTALLFDMNHSIAVNLASQLRSVLVQTGNQAKTFLFSEMYSVSGAKLSQKSLKDSQIKGIEFFKCVGNSCAPTSTKRAYPIVGYDSSKILPHLNSIGQNSYALWQEAGDPPRFFLANEIEIHEGNAVQNYVAVSELERTVFFSPVQSANLFQSYLATERGEVILSFDKSNFIDSKPIPDHPLLKAATSRDGSTTGVLSFQSENENWYGAYAPLGIGNLFFLSQANRSEVTSATHVLVQRSALFGLIVLTVTFMASVLFSKSLTENLHLLARAARRIQEGNLVNHIKISSGDEVEMLASSFNSMMDSLKASRDAIEEYNRELEAKVALRTQQLHETNAAIKDVQEQLLKSTQMAAIGEVAGKTAHEVLNPLTAIASRLERTRTEIETTRQQLPQQFSLILEAWQNEFNSGGIHGFVNALNTPSKVSKGMTLFEEDLENLKALSKMWTTEQTKVEKNLDFVLHEAERIHRIVDSMRQLVRSSDVKEDMHCHSLLKQAMTTMIDFLEKNGVQIVEDMGAENDIGHLNGDEFIQIITNLIRNAYQAISANETGERRRQGCITIKTVNDGPLLMIEVTDNGTGIPADKQSRIFDQGFTTKAPSEGTGLGLAICRRYARAFGGEVELGNSTPEGTTFIVKVPLVEASELKMVG